MDSRSHRRRPATSKPAPRRMPFPARNKAKLSKNTGQGPGRQGAESKNDETNPIGAQLPKNQRRLDPLWTPSRTATTCHQGSTEPIGFAPKWLRRLRKVLVNGKGLLGSGAPEADSAAFRLKSYQGVSAMGVYWSRGGALEVPNERFENVVENLLSTPPMPMADIPRKRQAQQPKSKEKP